MPMKPTPKITHRTALGREIDLDKLRIKHENTLAVGNARMNARGDELGPGGKVVKKREESTVEYHIDDRK